jgi:Cytochrome c7 and related cytochrome c/Class III cytochrome C family
MVLAMLCATTATVAGLFYAVGSADVATQDRQPIAFSHEFHAGQLKVDCLFCHRHAEYSPTASVPTVSACMSCHRAIKPSSPAMEELAAYWKDEQPIPWIRLQRLPDHVYFTHAMHLQTGLQCADCHGRVETMRETPRAPSFEMGWCVSCHQQREASLDCWTCHK